MKAAACVSLATLALVPASTQWAVVFLLCTGSTTWGLRYGFFRGVRYPRISLLAHHNRKPGPLLLHTGPTRIFVISATCSQITARYSIPRFAVIGPKVSGVALVYPDSQSAVNSKLDLQHALSSYKRVALHLKKLTGRCQVSRYTKTALPHDCMLSMKVTHE